MKKLLQIILYSLSAILAIAIAAIIIANKPLPAGVVGPRAEALTDSMMLSVNCEEWNRLRYVSWTYQDKHHYVWDKLYNLAEIQYDDLRILMNINTLDGIVWQDGRRLELHEKKNYLEHAWKIWSNDSFWLNPICKLREGGAVRRLVQMKDSSEALLVTYTRGGITPGDSFLWLLDDQYRPVAWRMWVRMLPVRGLRATWEQWTTNGDVDFSLSHKIGPYQIEITQLRTGRHHGELGLEKDPFGDFVSE